MKKKILFFLMILVASALIIPSANAAVGTPETLVVGEETVLIANGAELTITDPTTAGMGATITWNGGSVELPANAWVFGGTHNDTTNTVSSKITMEGGQLYAIVGGGLHASNVDTATIIVNGGTLKSIYGGGVASTFFDAPTAEELSHNYNGDAKVSTTKVASASITINGGTQTKYIYGGGMGYNYTGKTSITLNGGNQETVILTAGGANGYTGTSDVTINDGNVGTYQTVNRGNMDTATVKITGGTIGNAYVGGEPVSDVTGTFTKASMEITGGTITNLGVGTNGVDTNNSSISAKDSIALVYNKDTVTNIDETQFSEETVIKTVTLTFAAMGESESVEVPVGMQFTAEAVEELKTELIASLVDTDYTFDNFYANEDCTELYDMTQTINEDTTVYMKLVQLREEEEETATPEIANPNTSDISLYGIIAAITLAGVGLGYTIRKRKFN